MENLENVVQEMNGIDEIHREIRRSNDATKEFRSEVIRHQVLAQLIIFQK